MTDLVSTIKRGWFWAELTSLWSKVQALQEGTTTSPSEVAAK